LFAQTHRRQQELQARNTITETVTRSLDLNVLTQSALLTTIDVLKLSAGRMYVFDEQDRRLRLTAHHGIPIEQLEEISSYAPGTGIIGAIFEQEEPLIFPSVREDPVFNAAVHSERGVGERLSSVGLPITIKDRVVGVIHLYGRTVREFDAQDMEILSAIGRQIGVAIENARLFQETIERARQQEALNAIAAATSRSLGLEELFEIALDKVLEVTGRERASIRLRDAATGAVTLSAHRGFSDGEVGELRRRTAHRMSEEVFTSGEPVVVNESARDGDSQSLLPLSHSVAWVPLKSRANVIGVLGISATQPNPFSRREIDFLLAVGNVIGVALENMRLYENERNQVKSLRLLVNASQKLVEQVDIDALAHDILDTLVTSFGVRLAWIGSAEAGGRVRPLYWAGDVAEYLRDVEIRWDDSPLGHGPAGRAIRSGQPVVMDVAADPGFAPWREAALAHGYHEVAAFPLMRGAKPFGHLILYSGESGFFTPGRVELVQTYANIATAALENARLFQETQRSLNRIRALHEIDKAIASSLDLNVVLNVLLEQIEFFLPCPASSTIRLFNRNTGLLEPVACRNLDAETWKAWKGARGTANIVYETKVPIMIPNVQTDPRTQDPEFFAKNKLVSYLGVPLIVKDEALGVLGFYTKEERPFSQEEVEFLVTLAGQASIAIHNSQLYGETQKQAVALEQSNKVKDEFLSVMSHELRTPLIAIMGYAGLMDDELMGKNSPEQAKAIGVIKKESEHLLAMIREILEATRLESGAAIADKQPADLAKLLAEIEDGYSLPLGKPVALRWQYDSSFPLVHTDVMKLKQILQNLIANAIKFTEEGSITISARHSVEEQAVYFQVSDTGVGIASEMLPLIFDKFRQVDSSDTRSYEGVGLGLFIAKKFAELLGGTIGVQSEPGRGSTFTVILPCATFSAGAKRLDDCVNL
jgi:GAF domain-containing protein